MKFLIGVLVASLALSVVLALPARLPSDDAEVINVPSRNGVASRAGAGVVGTAADDADDDIEPDFKGFRGFIDTGVGYPFLAQPNPHPFLGFFDSFEDIFRRLHTRLWPFVLSDPEAAAAAGGNDASNDEEGLSVFNLNPKNGNTTSTVKIVDGHKIEVNETVYGDANNIFKVRVVNIRPVDSDENVDVDSVAKSDVNTANVVTSAPPKTATRNDADADDDDDDLDERREPLAKKQPTDNEIRGNIDEPEHSKHKASQQQYETMLPPTTNEDNAANLNAAFVTDNSLQEAVTEEEENQSGNENIEAETNKPVTDNEQQDDEDDDDNSDDDKEVMENYENDDVELAAMEQQPNDEAAAAVSSLVDNERLTIENNEEAAEIDNFNESSNEVEVEGSSTAANEQAEELQQDLTKEELQQQTTQQLTKELSELALSDEVADAEAVAAIEDFDETVKQQNVEAIADFNTESENEKDAKENDDDDETVAVNSSASHSNYAAVNKHREDVSSSDDEAEEDADDDEMNAEFNSEWANLAEDLASVNDKHNDLSNDIDVYDVEPVDLSNDIAVNDIAAAQADFPLNPDAEFIDGAGAADGDGAIRPHSSMPKFEKLSVDAAMTPTSYHQPAAYSQNMK